MAFKQSLNVPTPQQEHFNIDTFIGLKNNGAPAKNDHGHSPDCMNVLGYEDGVLESRPGVFKYGVNTFPEQVYSLHKYTTDSFEYILASSATKLYKLNVATDVISEVCVVNDTISGFQYEDKFYFVDGVAYREYDGTNVYEIIQGLTSSGIATAGATTTITLAATASAVDGYYNGWEIYIYSGTGALQKRTISGYVGATKVATISTAWGTAPNNTSAYYMTDKAQGSVYVDTAGKRKWYCPTYFEFSDTAKGANNIDMANDFAHIALHKNRVWFSVSATYKNIAMSTDIDNPYYVPVNTYIPPVTNDNDYLVGTYSFNDVLILFKARTAFALYGMDSTDYDLKELTVYCGPANIRTVAKVGNQLMYFGSNGVVYTLTDVRTDYKKILTKSISDDLDFIMPPISVFPYDWDQSHAVFHDKYYILCVKDKTLVHIVGRGWFVWNKLQPDAMMALEDGVLLTSGYRYPYRLAFNSFFVSETFTTTLDQQIFTLNKGHLQDLSTMKVYANGADITSQVEKYSNNQFQIDTPQAAGVTIRIDYPSPPAYSDDGRLYTCYWNTKDYDFGLPYKIKQLRKIYVVANTFKYYQSTLTFTVNMDYYQIGSGITINNQISLWGVAKFGERFINRNIATSTPVDVNQRGRIISFRVYAECNNNPFRLYGITGAATIR